MLKKIAALFIVIALTGGCKKRYPDDRWFHTSSARKLLTRGTWGISSAVPIPPYSFHPDCLNIACHFKKDGSSEGGCSRVIDHAITGNSYNYFFGGTWELINNDKNIKVTYDPSHYIIWTIKELDRRKMKLVNDSVEIECD